MRRIWSTTCAAIALGTTITVLAQDPSAPASQPQSASASAKTVTVTGCVQRAQAPTGTSGTRETASSTTKFVLTNAAINESGAAGTSGTAAAATAVASEYRLDADEAKLSPHISQKVEITGTVEQPSRTEQRPAASAANAPTLKVSDVKMVAPSCS